MATSDVWTTEDIDALDTVIQLKPHQKDIEFTTVTKTSDDKDLVSLDELYEKTGQESLAKIIDGFNSLIKHNKLKREHGVLLKVNGAESWMELPDRMNAVKGGESFIGNIVDGFIKIVLAIIKFIKGVCAWILTRIKSLLGFAKTQEEIKFLYEKSEWFKEEIAKILAQLDIHGFDPDEFVKELPDNMMPNDMLKVTKSKFEKTEDVINKYSDCIPSLLALSEKTINTDIGLSNFLKEYQDTMFLVKKAIKAGTISPASISLIKLQFSELSQKYLDPAGLTAAYRTFACKFYSIDETKLGVDGNIQALKEKIANQVDFSTIKYDKKLYQASIRSVKAYMSSRSKNKNYNLNPANIKKLQDLITKNDAELIKQLADITNDKELYSVFLSLSNTAGQYSLILNTIIEITQQADATLAGLIKLYSKTGSIVCALIAGDFSALSKAIDSLPEEEKKKIMGADPNFKIFHFETLNQMFYKEHPNGHVEKRISDAIASWLSSPLVSRFMKSFNNYARGFNQ